MSDIQLLTRWRRGDQAAGNELFKRHFRPLYRFFRSKVSNAVEDLVQDTLLACVRGRDRLREDGSFRAYMFAAARRILMQHYKRAGRSDLNFTQDSVADLTPGPSSIIARREDDRQILEALRMLPIDYQIALELHDWEGMTGPEVAQVLDLPEGTVRSRIRRGRIQLREKLQELATSATQLQSTMTRLEDWAEALRRLVSPDVSDRGP